MKNPSSYSAHKSVKLSFTATFQSQHMLCCRCNSNVTFSPPSPFEGHFPFCLLFVLILNKLNWNFRHTDNIYNSVYNQNNGSSLTEFHKMFSTGKASLDEFLYFLWHIPSAFKDQNCLKGWQLLLLVVMMWGRILKNWAMGEETKSALRQQRQWRRLCTLVQS